MLFKDEDEADAGEKPKYKPGPKSKKTSSSPKYKPGPKSKKKVLNPWMNSDDPHSDSGDKEQYYIY